MEETGATGRAVENGGMGMSGGGLLSLFFFRLEEHCSWRAMMGSDIVMRHGLTGKSAGNRRNVANGIGFNVHDNVYKFLAKQDSVV